MRLQLVMNNNMKEKKEHPKQSLKLQIELSIEPILEKCCDTTGDYEKSV